MKIILASKSPRRTELLNLINVKHEIIPSLTEEKIDESLSNDEVVKKLALDKAKDVAKAHPHALVIGADTIVCIDNQILGKPKTEEDAIKMLKTLSNKTHEVKTGVALIKNEEIINFVETSLVTFYEMTDDEILEYIHYENVYDKAGSYAIQGLCARHIKEIKGDYYNIMGLPISKIYQIIKELK